MAEIEQRLHRFAGQRQFWWQRVAPSGKIWKCSRLTPLEAGSHYCTLTSDSRGPFWWRSEHIWSKKGWYIHIEFDRMGSLFSQLSYKWLDHPPAANTSTEHLWLADSSSNSKHRSFKITNNLNWRAFLDCDWIHVIDHFFTVNFFTLTMEEVAGKRIIRNSSLLASKPFYENPFLPQISALTPEYFV